MNNIKRIYWISGFTNLYFGYSIWMIYLQKNGISLVEIALLQSSLNLAMLALEVPTGILADKIGEKLSIVFGCLFLIIHSTILALAPYDFNIQIVGFLFAGSAYALFSGSTESLLYKSIQNIKKENAISETKVFGINNTISTWSQLFAIMTGGFLSEYFSYKMVFFIMPIAFLIALIISSKLQTSFTTKITHTEVINEKFATTINKFRKDFILIIALSAIIAITSLYIIYSQEILYSKTQNTIIISSIISISLLFEGLSSYLSHKIENYWNFKIRLMILIIAMAIGFSLLLLNNINAYAISIIMISIIFGLLDPQILNYINALSTDKYRVTLNSIFSSLSSALMILIGPIIVFMVNNSSYSLPYLFAVTSIITLLLIAFMLYRRFSKE